MVNFSKLKPCKWCTQLPQKTCCSKKGQVATSTLTQFAVAESFLFHLASEGPYPPQFGLLVVSVLPELQQSLLVRHFLLLQLLPLLLHLQVAQTLLLPTWWSLLT